MSRSAEEQQLLEQRIQAMKLKNEELRRRHLEVEADKQIAAKHNAMVRLNVPHDDDWIPGRHDDSPRQDRNPHPNDSSPVSHQDQSNERGQRFDPRRASNDWQRGGGGPSKQPHRSQNSSGWRNEYEKPNGDRYHFNENRRSVDRSDRTNDSSNGRSKEWSSHPNRGTWNNSSSFSSDGSKESQTTFTSKVFKNSSMDPVKRFSNRLVEGDGPPPDPSYSFLGDSMRDSPEITERRRGSHHSSPNQHPNRRGFFRGRGRGGQSWSNRNKDSRDEMNDDQGERPTRSQDVCKQQSYDAWRHERNIIDQERINRQKTSDGNWSREWDSDKVLQEDMERPRGWRRQNQNFDCSYQQRGYRDSRGSSTKKPYTPRPDFVPNSSNEARVWSDNNQSPSKDRMVRRGRFSQNTRFRDHSNSNRFGASQQKSTCETDFPGDSEVIEKRGKSVEQRKVSLISDSTGTEKSCVEDVGDNLAVSLTQDERNEGKKSGEKHIQRKSRKAKRNRVLSSTSTGTTGTAEEDDASWEDLTSDEDVSILTELKEKDSLIDGITSKLVEQVSSGPESLDPIPAPGKDDEFLWDDFHPAGFQDNVPMEMDAETAYRVLLDENERANREVIDNGLVGDASAEPLKVSFRLDTSCLEDSGDDLEGGKLDPLLVTTKIVQAEVDCMSLSSIPTDTSLPDDVSQLSKTKNVKDGKIPEEEVANPGHPVAPNEVSALSTELPGLVSTVNTLPPAEKSSECSSDITNLELNDEKNLRNNESLFSQLIHEAEHHELSSDEAGIGKEELIANQSDFDDSKNSEHNEDPVNCSTSELVMVDKTDAGSEFPKEEVLGGDVNENKRETGALIDIHLEETEHQSSNNSQANQNS